MSNNQIISVTTILAILAITLFLLEKISSTVYLVILIPTSMIMLFCGIIELRKALRS